MGSTSLKSIATHQPQDDITQRASIAKPVGISGEPVFGIGKQSSVATQPQK